MYLNSTQQGNRSGSDETLNQSESSLASESDQQHRQDTTLYSRRQPIVQENLNPLLGNPSSQWSLSNSLHRRSTTESLQDVSCDYYRPPPIHKHAPQLDNVMDGGEAALRQKCKAFKDEFDTLHKCYADLVLVHSAHVSKMELAQEELSRVKKQIEDIKRDRDAVVRERNVLDQQCSAAIAQWDNTLRERDDCREQLQRAQQLREEAIKDLNQVMATRIKTTKELNRLTEERNAAVREHKLIMSERESVHKEMEKLQEELAKKNDELSTRDNRLKSLEDDNEGLKREIDSAMQDRDRVLKECNQLRESSPLQKQHEEDSQAYKDQIEALQGEVARVKSDLVNAQQEAEVSKRRRDWAFGERDKIVQERESIRTLCDKLRKERDNVVSDLAEALRDSEDAKRQANKELDELRQLQLGVALSKDSAIDIMEEYETTTKVVKLKLDGSDIGGGFETCRSNDTVWVSRIDPGSPADGMLSVHDQIVKINGNSVFQMGAEIALEMLQSASDHLKLEVKRKVNMQQKFSVKRGYFSCELQVPEKEAHGLVLETGVYVAHTVPGTPGAQTLQQGDRIIAISGHAVMDMQHALEELDKPGRFQLQVCRSSALVRETTKDRSANTTPKKLITVSAQTDKNLMKQLLSPTEKKSTNTFIDRAKSKLFGEKKPRPLSTIQQPIMGNDPEDAIFELDSVIDRFTTDRKSTKSHKGSSSSKENQSRANNGGTWPKYKAPLAETPLVDAQFNVHTLQPSNHRKKERKTIPKQFYHSSTDSSPVSSGNSPVKLEAYAPPMSSTGLSFPGMAQSTPSSRKQSKERYYSMTTPRPHTKPLSLEGSPSLVTAQTSTLQPSGRPRSAHYPPSQLEYFKHPRTPKEATYEVIMPPTLQAHPAHSQGHLMPHNPLYTNYYANAHTSRHPMPPHVGPTPCCPTYISRSGDSLLSTGVDTTSTTNFNPPTAYAMKDGRVNYSGSYTPSPCPSSLTAYSSYSPTYPMEFSHYHLNPYGGAPPPHVDVDGGHHGHHSLGPIPSNHYSSMAHHQTVDGVSIAGLATFPKRQQRIRIPPTPSVSPSVGRVSTGSIDRPPSPIQPALTVELLNSAGADIELHPKNRKPKAGDTRRINIEKSKEPLGIQIKGGSGQNIFVSSVTENSLAEKAGLQIGDQLLEVCGINMRNATYQLAANVLRQCRDSMSMLVQYNPDKYLGVARLNESGGNDSSTENPPDTPEASPKVYRKKRRSPVGSLSEARGQKINPMMKKKVASDPRVVVLNKPSSSSLGITLLGGNAVGIFVHSIEPDSPAAAGLRPGDQILEYNGIDLRNSTAEDAASELAKPTGGDIGQLKMLVQENLERYNEIQECGNGDAFYVRALFDRAATDGALAIKKDDVFFVDNTMYKGANGLWRAWLVDQDGRKTRCGFIPSKYKAEEELMLKRSLLDIDDGGRRGSARRSFFRRRPKSTGTREIAAYSDASINSSSYSDSASMLADEMLPPSSYLRVEKLCYTSFRPVILIGPLSDLVMFKLEQDYPDMFKRCPTEAMRGSEQMMEKGVNDCKLLDYQRRNSLFECITICQVKSICEKSHAFLEVSLSLDVVVERLHKCRIYPIVIFIKFKSTKQIREVKDCRYVTEKMTPKAAKEMYEHSLKIESEYKHLINGTIQGNNLTYMCTQVKAWVETQQNQTLWIPAVQY